MDFESGSKVLINPGEKRKKKKVDIEALRKKDNELVKIRFHNLESPGSVFRFPYRKYKGDPIVIYELHDQHNYELPIGVVKHLNTNVGRIEHKRLLDKEGNPSILAQRRVRRCMAENLEFVDIESTGTTHIDPVTVDNLPPLRK